MLDGVEFRKRRGASGKKPLDNVRQMLHSF